MSLAGKFVRLATIRNIANDAARAGGLDEKFVEGPRDAFRHALFGILMEKEFGQLGAALVATENFIEVGQILIRHDLDAGAYDISNNLNGYYLGYNSKDIATAVEALAQDMGSENSSFLRKRGLNPVAIDAAAVITHLEKAGYTVRADRTPPPPPNRIEHGDPPAAPAEDFRDNAPEFSPGQNYGPDPHDRFEMTNWINWVANPASPPVSPDQPVPPEPEPPPPEPPPPEPPPQEPPEPPGELPPLLIQPLTTPVDPKYEDAAPSRPAPRTTGTPWNPDPEGTYSTPIDPKYEGDAPERPEPKTAGTPWNPDPGGTYTTPIDPKYEGDAPERPEPKTAGTPWNPDPGGTYTTPIDPKYEGDAPERPEPARSGNPWDPDPRYSNVSRDRIKRWMERTTTELLAEQPKKYSFEEYELPKSVHQTLSEIDWLIDNNSNAYHKLVFPKAALEAIVGSEHISINNRGQYMIGELPMPTFEMEATILSALMYVGLRQAPDLAERIRDKLNDVALFKLRKS